MCDTHVLPSTHGVDRLRRIARGARGLGRGELRRRCLHRGTAPHVVSFRVLRHRGDGCLRGGRGVGGRGGQDGGLVDLVALSGAAGGGQAPGASGADLAPPARGGRGLACGVHRARCGPGHRLGPPASHRGRHGPRRGDAGGPGRRLGLRGLLRGPCPIGSSWPTPTGPRPPTRSARPRATSFWSRASAACGWAR